MKAFKLSEITAMQLKCIAQLNEMKLRHKSAPVLKQINDELVQRKHWAMNPVEVQV